MRKRISNGLIRVAYGGKGINKKIVSLVKLVLVYRAETPMEFLETYFLVHNDKALAEIFFKRVRTISFSNGQWKFLFDNSSKFGLTDLKAYAESELLKKAK